MWRRIVSLFYRKPYSAHSEAVEALFAANLSAQKRAGLAANHVAQSADRTRSNLHLLRQEIARRTDLESRARPSPPTSDVRSLVETALARVQPRPEKKG